jgi:hypothetical protein
MSYTPSVFIRTRFLAPTHTRGARITARTLHQTRPESLRGVAWNHALDSAGNHEAAARLLIAKRLGVLETNPRAACARLLGVTCKDGMLFVWDL